MAEEISQDEKGSPAISWSDTARFIRQLSHDLRNDLNAIELQSTYIGELEKNQEIRGEIKRLREMVSGLAATLQQLSRAVGDVKPTLISYRAADLMQDLRKKIETVFPTQTAEITWEIEPAHASLEVDPQLLQEVFTELFANAFRHDRGKGQLLAKAKIDGGRFCFTLIEPKDGFELATQNWGREPLRKITQRHYGLGLNRLRAIAEAHGGDLHAQYDPDICALITTITLPVANEACD
jgi:signal transduction histidine kinase